jgi:hypothetical protein
LENILLDAESNEIDFPTNEDDTDETVYLPPQTSCASHKLNLVAKVDVLSQCKNNSEFMKTYNSSFTKLKKLWNKQNHSSKFSDEIRDKFGTLFSTEVDTRWFLLYEAVSDFLKKYNNFKTELDSLYEPASKRKKSDESLMPLSEEEICFLKEYHQVSFIPF